jgi:hypothetical protein
MKALNRNYPEPIAYTRALRILFTREHPHAKLLDNKKSEITTRLRKRAPLRIVADLFNVSPQPENRPLDRSFGR